MSLIELAKQERKRTLILQERLERLTGSGGSAAYIPGEPWRNNKLYLTDDTVKDGNGKTRRAKRENINKPPANHPDDWELVPSEEPIYTAWSNDPVGTQYFNGSGGTIQSLRRHNSQNWKCKLSHVKTAGNGPRAGSEFWELA